MKVAVLSTSLGGFDEPVKHTNQLVKADYFNFTDDNFPPRDKSMTPRLQAKIPKMFGWQLKPGYDAYLWLDGNLALAHAESIQYFLDALEDHDVVVLKHPERNSLHWEYRYNWRGLNSNAPSNYLTKRYAGELLDEQYSAITADGDYTDDRLVTGGVFMYRNTPQVRSMLKEWFYNVCRYTVMDQLAFTYVLRTSGLKLNILRDSFKDSMWLSNTRHAK